MASQLYFTATSCGAASYISAKKAGLIGNKVVPNLVDIREHKVKSGALKDSDFYKVNPKGNVPTLVLEDGTVLNENAAVLQRIADLAPAGALAPANGTNARYLLQSKLSYISSEVHSSFGPLFNPALHEEVKTWSLAKLATKLDYLNRVELAGKKFIVGDSFTVADAYLYIVLSWSGYLKVDLSKYPEVERYFKGISELDFVKEAHAEMNKSPVDHISLKEESLISMPSYLYFTPTSCGAASYISARKAGLIGNEIIPILVNLATHTIQSGPKKNTSFYKVNPKGNIPALVLEDGTLLNENAAVLQRIADYVPDTLAPLNGTNSRYVLQSKLSYISSEIHSIFGPLYHPEDDCQVKKWSKEQLERKFDYLNKYELCGKQFLVGDSFTVADAYLYIVLSWTKEVDLDLSKYPHVEKYFYAIGELNFVKDALEEMNEFDF
ncbi:hypothetical protein HDV06_000552 [Boothiomyces sp. JEL0866]|nr:hypothetical protein HDV06_000552 [Boothiomyces sp. JEL0866]